MDLTDMYNAHDAQAILAAAALAAEAHHGQVRKAGLGPYIQHPMRVAQEALEAGLPTYAVQAALLHDVLEDAPNPDLWEGRIAALDRKALHLVRVLTHSWADHDHETAAREKPAHYAAIAATPWAADLKLLDRADNLSDMVRMWQSEDPKLRKWVTRYLAKTRAEIVPLHKHVLSEGAKIRFQLALAALIEVVEPKPVTV